MAAGWSPAASNSDTTRNGRSLLDVAGGRVGTGATGGGAMAVADGSLTRASLPTEQSFVRLIASLLRVGVEDDAARVGIDVALDVVAAKEVADERADVVDLRGRERQG